MSELVPANFGQVSTRFQNTPIEDDLSSGIQSSFAIMGYKGKVWSIRYRGDEQALMRDDGDGPRGSIEAVILKSSKSISKVWYEHGYVEGSNAAPDCFSNNGVAPEPTSAKKQCDTCALCPHNQWGSRVTPTGKAGKACADSKRIAISPLADVNNEMYGGPMLLRVPAASLQDLAMYGQKMQQLGYPYYAVGTRIGFDPQEAYPKFVFGAIRPLNDAEADAVIALRDGHQVDRIMSESEYQPAPGVSQAAPTVQTAFEQPPEQPAQQATQPAQQETKPAQATVGNAAQQHVQATQTAQASGGGFGATAPANTQQEAKPEPAQTAQATGGGFGATAPVGNQPATEAAPQATQQEPAPEPKPEPKPEENPVPQQTKAADTGDGNVASSFEQELDDMLADLL